MDTLAALKWKGLTCKGKQKGFRERFYEWFTFRLQDSCWLMDVSTQFHFHARPKCP
jgi:hypothetical protein